MEEEFDETYVPPVVSSVGDARTIRFQTRIINQHLVCTLCMGYFNDACTIIECLHTFCRACIMRHFRDSSMCPQCELGLGTNPKDLVRTDRTLQSIVDKVFPPAPRKSSGGGGGGGGGSGGGGDGGSGGGGNGDAAAANSVDEVEGEGEAVEGMQAASERRDAPPPDSEDPDGSGAPQTSAFRMDDGAADGHSASEAGAHADDGGGGGGGSAAQKAADSASSGGGASSAAEVSFSLLEYGGGLEVRTPLEKPYLRTKALLSIGHLRKYLGKKLSLPPEAAVEFFCRDEPLDSALTLDEIARTVWKDETADLVLHYRAVAA